MLSLGLAQFILFFTHSTFNLNLYLSLSPIEPTSSLLFCVLLGAPSTPFQCSLQSPSLLLSSCLSPLTSFFRSFSKYSFFLSLQTPDSWGRSKPNSWGKQRTERVRWQCCSLGNGFWRGIKTAHLINIKSWIKPPASLYWYVAFLYYGLKLK